MITSKTLRSLGLKSLRLAVTRFGRRLHNDQSGSISIATVFAFIFLTMVLGMIMNIGRHADRKIKIQNAADAATLTGGTLVARSMNTLAFTNHLLCDVFALTAYLREARDRNAESMTPEILQRWNKMAREFADAPHKKFSDLAQGIPSKTPLEADLIQAFSDQNAAVSENLLPVMEQILEYEMIPEFQRALVLATPSLATQAANEIASRHGPVERGLSAGRIDVGPDVANEWGGIRATACIRFKPIAGGRSDPRFYQRSTPVFQHGSSPASPDVELVLENPQQRDAERF